MNQEIFPFIFYLDDFSSKVGLQVKKLSQQEESSCVDREMQSYDFKIINNSVTEDVEITCAKSSDDTGALARVLKRDGMANVVYGSSRFRSDKINMKPGDKIRLEKEESSKIEELFTVGAGIHYMSNPGPHRKKLICDAIIGKFNKKNKNNLNDVRRVLVVAYNANNEPFLDDTNNKKESSASNRELLKSINELSSDDICELKRLCLDKNSSYYFEKIVLINYCNFNYKINNIIIHDTTI
jgi:hypothetical protein